MGLNDQLVFENAPQHQSSQRPHVAPTQERAYAQQKLRVADYPRSLPTLWECSPRHTSNRKLDNGDDNSGTLVGVDMLE